MAGLVVGAPNPAAKLRVQADKVTKDPVTSIMTFTGHAKAAVNENKLTGETIIFDNFKLTLDCKSKCRYDNGKTIVEGRKLLIKLHPDKWEVLIAKK